MKNFYKIPSILAIIILLGIIGYSTYIKFTYNDEPETTIPNNNEINNNENEDDNLTTKNKTLSCNHIYYDDTNTKANIVENIEINFENDEAISQQYEIIYSFTNENDYNLFKENSNYEETAFNDEEMKVSLTQQNNYTTPYNSNDKFDYREKNIEEAKNELESQDFDCIEEE